MATNLRLYIHYAQEFICELVRSVFMSRLNIYLFVLQWINSLYDTAAWFNDVTNVFTWLRICICALKPLWWENAQLTRDHHVMGAHQPRCQTVFTVQWNTWHERSESGETGGRFIHYASPSSQGQLLNYVSFHRVCVWLKYSQVWERGMYYIKHG